ncbi:hypothetical protein ACP70R_050196 [Stipagrostis hirtigluma subsp. patula]
MGAEAAVKRMEAGGDGRADLGGGWGGGALGAETATERTGGGGREESHEFGWGRRSTGRGREDAKRSEKSSGTARFPGNF